MALSASELKPAVTDLRQAQATEDGRLRRIWNHLNDNVTGRRAGVYVPVRVTAEYRMLVEQARFNVLDLVVTAVAQNLFVDGYRPTSGSGRVASGENLPIWDDVWQANRMDARQSGLFRAAISYGSSYAVVVPGDPVPVITPVSPLKLTALYQDPVNDEWPEIAMCQLRDRVVDGRRIQRVELYDDEQVWTLDVPESGEPQVRSVEVHGLGVTPIVRFLDRYDLAGSPGKVEPLIPLQQQLNQTTFSLLMAQQYGAFRQRYVTGMEIQTDENGNPKAPFNPAVDSIFQAESPDSRFGEFNQTDLDGYLSSRQAQLLHVASVAQIPPHNLITGAGISNISAEALAALEAGHQQDIAEHKISFGESVEQMLRLSGRAMRDDETWADTSAQVVWRDTTPRSLSQVADALGKLAAQLGIPPKALWERIPGVTDQDIDRWSAMLAESDLMAQLDSIVEGVTNAEPAGPVVDLAASA